MTKKVKIEVHTPFNLILAPKAGGDHPFQEFPLGVHTVSEEVAAHPWVKQHSKVPGADIPVHQPKPLKDETPIHGSDEEVEEASEEEPEEEEVGEEASEVEEEASEEEPEEEEAAPVRRRGRR